MSELPDPLPPLPESHKWSFERWPDLAEAVRAYAMQAVLAERERCAAIVDVPAGAEERDFRCGPEGVELMRDLAAAIRSQAR